LNSFLGLRSDANIEKAKSSVANRVARQAGAVGATSLPLNFTITTKWPACATTFNIIQDQSQVEFGRKIFQIKLGLIF
jgi:hypothetical protein